MSEVSGSIWGSHPPRKENTMVKEEQTHYDKRTKQRKLTFLNKIMGELEAFVERPGEEWTEEEETAVFDMLDYVSNAVKAQLSENDSEYQG